MTEPEPQRESNIVTDAPTARLRRAMTQHFDSEDVTFAESNPIFAQQLKGLPNPYGRGLRAYEPNTLLFDAYDAAKNAVAVSRAAEDALKDSQIDIPGVPGMPGMSGTPDFAGGGMIDADGMVGKMIGAAMNLAARKVPYVWGGTSSSGVDCSGLIFYAARAAGIPWLRYRAVDYGRLGSEVSLEAARPGDVVYYDEAGDTDHVGIYIGNGQMIQAPQSGDVVKVSGVGKFTSIRRIFNDAQFGATALPTGDIGYLYNGRTYNPSLSVYQTATRAPFLGPLLSGPTYDETSQQSGRIRRI